MLPLIHGIQKFQSEVFPDMEPDFVKLGEGQSPATLFITCSDSRISPNLVTQTNPGEIFVIRNAGNIVPKPGEELGVEATIQYAVDVLKVGHIVVCGHSCCGAVSGLLNLESLNSLPVIKEWVSKSAEILDEVGDGDERVNEAIEANVALQLRNLRTHKCVADAIAERNLELHGWVYHFESGKVDTVQEKQAS